VTCLLRVRTVKPAETDVVRERLCKHDRCYLSRDGSGRHASNKRKPLEVVFSVWFVPMLSNELPLRGSRERESADSRLGVAEVGTWVRGQWPWLSSLHTSVHSERHLIRFHYLGIDISLCSGFTCHSIKSVVNKMVNNEEITSIYICFPFSTLEENCWRMFWIHLMFLTSGLFSVNYLIMSTVRISFSSVNTVCMVLIQNFWVKLQRILPSTTFISRCLHSFTAVDNLV
jgi:hypothetical protein